MPLGKGADPTLFRMRVKPAHVDSGDGDGGSDEGASAGASASAESGLEYSEVIEVGKERLHGVATTAANHMHYQFAYASAVPPSCFFRTTTGDPDAYLDP